MTSHKHDSRPEGEPIAPRYGFNDTQLRRHDWKYSEGMKTKRVLEYPKPNEQISRVRSLLHDKGLVLGQQVEASSAGLDRFMIPTSVRPIKYDTGSQTSNPLLYDDASRFRDLGGMLKEVARLDPSVYELQDGIGENVAEMEFTRPGERRLYFVPGFESNLAPTMDGHEAVLHRYANRLSAEFGNRFDQHIEQFAEGFDQ